ncbi:MAG TPA: hypothetical protein VK009_02900 [Chloroflexota bacterium]|nr:hypothetical protein [Chloroflexota bacterium]
MLILLVGRGFVVLAALAVIGALGLALGVLIGWGIGQLGMLAMSPGYHLQSPDTAYLKLLAALHLVR